MAWGQLLTLSAVGCDGLLSVLAEPEGFGRPYCTRAESPMYRRLGEFSENYRTSRSCSRKVCHGQSPSLTNVPIETLPPRSPPRSASSLRCEPLPPSRARAPGELPRGGCRTGVR